MLSRTSQTLSRFCFSATMNHFFGRTGARFICCFNSFHFSLTLNTRKFSHFSGNIESGSWRSMEGLVRCSANCAPLTPISFLERAAKAYRDRTSVVYGSLKYTWGETHERCLRLASALTQLGISPGDVVGCFIFTFLFSLRWISYCFGAFVIRSCSWLRYLINGLDHCLSIPCLCDLYSL